MCAVSPLLGVRQLARPWARPRAKAIGQIHVFSKYLLHSTQGSASMSGAFLYRPEKAANGRRRKKLRILELPETDLTVTWQCDLVTSGGEAQAPAPVDCWRNCA